MPKYNPFRPNSIVNPGMFCGRWDEMKAIEQSLFQAKHGNPKHFLVQGERGIGKSSLLLAVEFNARGDVEISSGTKFNFIVVSIELIGASTYDDTIASIASEFKAEIGRRQQIKQFATAAWDFITNWKVMGVEYKKEGSRADDLLLIDSLCEGMATFLNNAGAGIDGVLILIDEADKPPEEARLGEFAKLFTEKMTKLRCDRVCLGLAGLPSLIPRLRASHESAPRVFETLTLEPLEAHECEEVVRRGLAEAAQKNGFETTIEDPALKSIVRLSEGYPHFIQQFAYSAFEEADGANITLAKVNVGAFKENGALDQLGKRYFAELYFDRIASRDYRRVLNAMANQLDAWVPRAGIIKSSGVRETQVNNALKALRERGIILVNEQKKGEYRLPTKSFAVWIRALNIKQQQQQQKDKNPRRQTRVPRAGPRLRSSQSPRHSAATSPVRTARRTSCI
jgi:hypothetical protein